MCGYRLACVCAYLCFSSMVGAGQYERYPVPTHPLWSWLNDPWPEDVHAREGERVGGRVAEEGQKRGSGRRKAVGWGTTNKKKMKTAADKAEWEMQTRPVWRISLSLGCVLTWPQSYPSAWGALSLHLYGFHSLCLIHLFHRAHRSQLIKDRMKTANGALTCSPQWTQAEGARER